MSDIKAALYAYLSADPQLVSLVGDRIYANWAAPETPEPYVIISRIDDFNFAPHQGGRTEATQSTIQLDIWALYSLAVENVVTRLKQLLDGFQTQLMDTVWVYSTRLTSVFDGPLSPNDGSQAATARSTMSFEVWHG